MQRGTCPFETKAVNAEAAGAVGAVIFNEGQPPATPADEDRRTLWLISPKSRYQLSVTWDGVMHPQTSHALPVLGWMWKDGGLVLTSLREGGVLYQALPGAIG